MKTEDAAADDQNETDENNDKFSIKMISRPEKANILLFFAGTVSNYLCLYIKSTKRLELM